MMFANFYKNTDYIYESFTHRNLTLENILIYKDKIIFIDPYKENNEKQKPKTSI